MKEFLKMCNMVEIEEVNNAIFKYESGETNYWPYKLIAEYLKQPESEMQLYFNKALVDKESGR